MEKKTKTKFKKTRKIVKVLGEEEYINKRTGEIQKMQVISYEDRDANFEKLWLGHILEALDLIGNCKIKVLATILRLRDRNNRILGSQQLIATESETSLKTVADTYKQLIELNILKKEANNIYMINPDVIFKGGKGDRMNILLQYDKSDGAEETEEETEPKAEKEMDGERLKTKKAV